MNLIKAKFIGNGAMFLREGAGETGHVHSEFYRVINLAFPGRRLISVSQIDVSNSPTNIVTNLKGCGWPELGVKAGAAVVMAGQLLCLGQVSVDLSSASLWIPAIRQSIVSLPSQKIKRNILRLNSVAGLYVNRQGLSPLLPYLDELLAGGCPLAVYGDPFLQTAANSIAGLIIAIKTADLPAVCQAARGLVGLGPGLTPSGDDFLSGLMAGMVFSQQIACLNPLVSAARINAAIVSQTEGRTNDISRQLLEFSARGEVTETMEAVILAVLRGPKAQLEQSIVRLVTVGASSGTDQLLGIMLGISLLLSD
jgi:hypothetical protein